MPVVCLGMAVGSVGRRIRPTVRAAGGRHDQEADHDGEQSYRTGRMGDWHARSVLSSIPTITRPRGHGSSEPTLMSSARLAYGAVADAASRAEGVASTGGERRVGGRPGSKHAYILGVQAVNWTLPNRASQIRVVRARTAPRQCPTL